MGGGSPAPGGDEALRTGFEAAAVTEAAAEEDDDDDDGGGMDEDAVAADAADADADDTVANPFFLPLLYLGSNGTLSSH